MFLTKGTLEPTISEEIIELKSNIADDYGWNVFFWAIGSFFPGKRVNVEI